MAFKRPTLWCQLEDTFQLIVTPQGIELVMVHIEVISQCFKKYRVRKKETELSRTRFCVDIVKENRDH